MFYFANEMAVYAFHEVYVKLGKQALGQMNGWNLLSFQSWKKIQLNVAIVAQ